MHIAIIGDYDPTKPSRATIAPALEHAAHTRSLKVSIEWIDNAAAKTISLKTFDGIFISPGSPREEYASIINVIRRARIEKIPCLGSCGGFQRMVEAFAQEQLNLEQIEHAEIHPNAVEPLFSPLECSLSGKEGSVRLLPGTLAWKACAEQARQEAFYCSYGINTVFIERLKQCGWTVSGIGRQGDARIIELSEHPFFMGTLFVPQVKSTADQPHPLIVAFVLAVKKYAWD